MTTTTAKRPVAVDIDDDNAAVLANRFLPSHAQASACDVPGSGYDGLTEAGGNILETIRMLDHAWFAKHPGRWEYIRELLPAECDVPPDPPPLGKRWMVKVTAFRDRDKRVMLRIREGVLLNATAT